ncbi:MAG: hypothetical protein ACK47N_19025 [Microcystis sp.]|uniref:hypothetical protein n=1 Tax=Microcystis sp. TaxID=1127 RepID=UPI0026CE4382
MEFATRAIHGAVTVAIYLGSYEYSRTGNPTRRALDGRKMPYLSPIFWLIIPRSSLLSQFTQSSPA